MYHRPLKGVYAMYLSLMLKIGTIKKQAKEEKELPERLLAGVRLSNVDFSKSEGKPLQGSQA